MGVVLHVDQISILEESRPHLFPKMLFFLIIEA